VVLSLGAALAVVASSCERGAGSGDPAEEQVSSALTAADVLGFESTAGWKVSSGRVSSTATRTQGNAALAVAAPVNYTTLVSAALASGQPQLAALTDSGSSMLIDLLQPIAQPNPFYLGALQMYVSCPSRGVYNQYLGQVELTGKPVGLFATYAFAVTDFVRARLTDASFSDLTFTAALNAPSGATGTYVFDNLRATSPASTPVGAGTSIDVTATFGAPGAGPGVADFAAGTIQIPASFHVNAGTAGSGGLTLGLGFGPSPTVTCTYKASADAASYLFSSCSTRNVAGDIVAASHVALTLIGPLVQFTKVHAQLAYNAVGDRVGTGLVPPIPTFWGNQRADIDAIGSAFVQALRNNPPPETRVVRLPVPEYAKRHGNASPDGGAIPQGIAPNDPPFLCNGQRCQGHLNAGGDFDAFWTLDGGLTVGSANNAFSANLSASAGVHGVLFGNQIDMAEVDTTLNSDTGQTTTAGFVNSSASGEVIVKLFGVIVEDQQVSGEVDFGPFNLSDDQSFDAPPIPLFGIITVTVGVDAHVGVTTSGHLAFAGPTVTVTPTASAGAHLAGKIDVGFASGGVDVKVDLIKVSLPLTASALWSVNTAPDVCAASLTFDVNGQLQASTLGGEVDLEASIGFCPFCYSTSFPIFHWDGVTLAQVQIFDVNASNQITKLNPQTPCHVDLDVSIVSPPDGSTVVAGLGVAASAIATRPQTPGQPVETVPCSGLTWTSSDPTVPQQTGCTPTLKFGTPGPQTVTVNAVDAFNEHGTATVTVNVEDVAGPAVSIHSPLPLQRFSTPTQGPVPVPFELEIAPHTTTDAISVQLTSELGVDLADLTVPAGSNPDVILDFTVLMTATDPSPTVTVTVTNQGTGEHSSAAVSFFVNALT
jgi:hypothetical protein